MKLRTWNIFSENFTMYACVRFLLFLVAFKCVCSDDDETSPKLRYYYDSVNVYTEVPMKNAETIFSLPWYNATRNTVIFAHGFTGTPEGPAVTEISKAFIKHGYNVILLNWDRMAAPINPSLANSYLNWAAPNTRTIGVDFAKTLLTLSEAGLDLNTTQLVGHSLGAHLFGIAGNNLLAKGIQLPWITGLDPAGISFENKPSSLKLNPSSAKFVMVIHSDPSKYGYKKSMGTVDFWPNYKNGPVKQPGCKRGPSPMFSAEDLCDHNRCWQLLIDALEHPGTLIGSQAKNYRTWKNNSPEGKNAVVLEVGKSKANVVPGNYYFITKSTTPYGLGKQGL